MPVNCKNNAKLDSLPKEAGIEKAHNAISLGGTPWHVNQIPKISRLRDGRHTHAVDVPLIDFVDFGDRWQSSVRDFGSCMRMEGSTRRTSD